MCSGYLIWIFFFSFHLKDVGGREMRVRFSVQMNAGRRSFETLNSSSIITFYYEGPHKVYVGNLARSATPEDLRHLFGGFGNVASVRVLQDLKQGKSRVYAFVSYLSERERDAAMSLHGTVKHACLHHFSVLCFLFTCLCLTPILVLAGILWSYTSS